jgi:hypothetical protein
MSKLQKGCTRLASDKVYQLLVHGRWFSPGTPASSTTKTGRHDIAEILLKVALKHQKSNQIEQILLNCSLFNLSKCGCSFVNSLFRCRQFLSKIVHIIYQVNEGKMIIFHVLSCRHEIVRYNFG